MTRPTNPRWSEILIEAVERPGLILEAYQRFHGLPRGPDYSERTTGICAWRTF